MTCHSIAPSAPKPHLTMWIEIPIIVDQSQPGKTLFTCKMPDGKTYYVGLACELGDDLKANHLEQVRLQFEHTLKQLCGHPDYWVPEDR